MLDGHFDIEIKPHNPLWSNLRKKTNKQTKLLNKREESILLLNEEEILTVFAVSFSL
jgi:hypothetical protein